MLGAPVRFGLGFALPIPAALWFPGPRVLVDRVRRFARLNDLDRRLTIAYVMNKMGGASRSDWTAPASTCEPCTTDQPT